MKAADFDYPLPADRIAQHPLPDRDRSRLLILHRADQSIAEAVFADLPGLLNPGDLLVVNDTRVAPLRLAGVKDSGGRAELTFIHRLGPDLWECLARVRNPRPGMMVTLAGGLRAEFVAVSEQTVRVEPEPDHQGAPLWQVRFTGADPDAVLARDGLPPLPPYIRRAPGHDPAPDRSRYQTVYARAGEAAAAPTAGLHFTPPLLATLAGRGIATAAINLEVGYGTFAPVRTEEIEDHRLHSERYELPAAAAAAVAAAKSRGGRVVAVGTTVVRTLEHSAGEDGALRPGAGETAMFIYPGYRFRVVDALITNFHLPRSTLLMLVAAFAGRDYILRAYRHALDAGFRFLSYGDAMLII
jgi:S-adenosylmethionine:tRNA ribosyltransferase-isomerase